MSTERYWDLMNADAQEDDFEGLGDVCDARTVIQSHNQEEIAGLGDIDAQVHNEIVKKPIRW